MEYGNIPQNRERVYMVGFRNKDYSEKFEFPSPVKLTVKITDLLEKMLLKNTITMESHCLKNLKVQ